MATQAGHYAYPGSFSSFQHALGQEWASSVSSIKRTPELTPEQTVKARKQKACLACYKRGFKVKAEYSTRKEKWNYSTYEVEVYTCPLCKKEEKVWQKVAGKGKSGKDSF